ncbi:MAG: pentapeptide repeat-containing protein [Desulfobacterales bacterium]|nr:MAG: pentapeptide repeat-containing protein [Desulfobacterales bacterium]
MLRFILWLLWDFTGLRFVWEKIRPPIDPAKQKRPPATIMIWALGILGLYIALFGLASQRYENRIAIVENRANAVLIQLATPAFKQAISKVATIQNMDCPPKPNLLEPLSVLRSLFSEPGKYVEMVQYLKETVEDWKDSLDGADLSRADLKNGSLDRANLNKANLLGANLQGANLEGASLQGASLWEVNLQQANLKGAFLQEANLRGANLREANLLGGNLEQASLMEANLQKAYLEKAYLSEAYLGNANLREADLREADLEKAELPEADLEKADLAKADLRRAYLGKARLPMANLESTDLRQADLLEANLQEAKLNGANLGGTLLIATNLRGASDLTVNQLCRAQTLHRSQLDPELEKQVQQTCPQLLEQPQ